eukprot:9730060-Alexandrium_andersonii.AAC.1
MVSPSEAQPTPAAAASQCSPWNTSVVSMYDRYKLHGWLLQDAARAVHATRKHRKETFPFENNEGRPLFARPPPEADVPGLRAREARNHHQGAWAHQGGHGLILPRA